MWQNLEFAMSQQMLAAPKIYYGSFLGIIEKQLSLLGQYIENSFSPCCKNNLCLIVQRTPTTRVVLSIILREIGSENNKEKQMQEGELFFSMLGKNERNFCAFVVSWGRRYPGSFIIEPSEGFHVTCGMIFYHGQKEEKCPALAMC